MRIIESLVIIINSQRSYIYCDTAVIKNASVTNLLGKMCHFMLSGARLFI